MILAQMIGRNESNRYLSLVLDRLSQQVDKIIFTDDHSDDNTAEIAAGYAEVYVNERPLFSEHEGLLRSIAWSNLEQHASDGDWVIAIDCDEMLYNKEDLDSLEISTQLSYSPFDVVNVRFYHMWNENFYRVDKAWRPNNSSRIFRFRKGGRFLDRKLACGSEPDYVLAELRRKNYWVNSSFVMQHLGYARDDDKQAKYARYSSLDKGQFHDLSHIESILDTSPALIKWGNFGI